MGREGTIGSGLHGRTEDPGELRAIAPDVDGRLRETTRSDEANVERIGQVEQGGLDDRTEVEEGTVHDWVSVAGYFDIKIVHMKPSCQES